MAVKAGKDETVVDSLDASLEILQPEEQFVEINGDKIFVKEYSFGKLMKAIKHLAKLQHLLAGTITQLEDNLLLALSDCGDDVIGLISLATDIPVEFFDDIPADKGLDLAVMTYKVNESFFVKNLLPKLQELFPSDSTTEEQPEENQLMTPAKVKKAGSTSSKS